MTRLALTCLLALSLAAPAAAADGAFWNNLKGRLDKVTPTRKPAMTTAVGGVRGSLETPAAQLYWKGEALPHEMDEQEMQAFNEAVDAAGKKDVDHALSLFESFIDLYPQSPLQADARKAIALLNPPPVPEPSAAAEPASADEVTLDEPIPAADGVAELTPAAEETAAVPVAAAEPVTPEAAVEAPAPVTEDAPTAAPAEAPPESAPAAPAAAESAQI